jgi:hypothetical protein
VESHHKSSPLLLLLRPTPSRCPSPHSRESIRRCIYSPEPVFLMSLGETQCFL